MPAFHFKSNKSMKRYNKNKSIEKTTDVLFCGAKSSLFSLVMALG